jgi:hypothetical protein
VDSRAASAFPLVREPPLACHIRCAVPSLASPFSLFPVSKTCRSRCPVVCTATMSRAAVYPTSSAGEDLTMFSLVPLSSSWYLAADCRSSVPMQPLPTSLLRTRAGHAAGPPCLGPSGRGPRASLFKSVAVVLFSWAAAEFSPLSCISFFHFLNIIKSMQIPKFVQVRFELRKL